MEILGFMKEYMKDPLLQKGIFEVLKEFIKRLQQQFMMKDQYRVLVRQFFTEYLYIENDAVRTALAKCLALWVDKMKD